MTTTLQDTLIIWRRFGKEHGEEQGFRVNPPAVVHQHLQAKVDAFRQTPPAAWRWRQVSDELLVETVPDTGWTVYYLPGRNWVAMYSDNGFPSNSRWKWYVHIGVTRRDPRYNAWVFTDLFVDVLLEADGRTHTVLDLDDLGHALQLGLITQQQAIDILADTQRLIDSIFAGDFPPPEIRAYQERHP